MEKQAVHFGAGNIGRGFLGQLYFESGYETTFIDVMEEVVGALQTRQSYPIRIVEESSQEILVEGVTAIHGAQLDEVAQALAKADIVSTAVGVNALPYIAPALAKGIEARFVTGEEAPLNIIICENLIHAADFLRQELEKQLPDSFKTLFGEKIGLVEASIGRMVPVMTEEQKAEDPLLVCVEPYCELPVDARAFCGPVPVIQHLKAMDNFGAYVERKLYVHNLSHAATAYLGSLRGHEYIWQAIRDAEVRELVEKATLESCAAMVKRHGLNAEELEAHRQDLLHRYHNRALADQISRVARDPMRKLGPQDRFIGAARLCVSQQVAPKFIAVAVAAALQYHQQDDPAAQTLQQIVAEQGVSGALCRVCQLEATSPLVSLIQEGIEVLDRKGWSRSLS